ncbi:hypothetical protein E6P97_03135 [Patescibacteria group bacterium]|nr:MAG: hypothetical protein E6P97_03135 [Patescibacteria group bacterium]
MDSNDDLLNNLPNDSKVAYQAGHTLLSALADLEEDLKHNYENGTVQQMALARLAGLQGDLFSSFMILLWQGPLIGRSVVLRSLIENQGNILHVKGDDRRSEQYIKYADKITTRVKDRVAGKATSKTNYKWTNSTVEQRVALFPDDNVSNVYDTLSDYVHGNNAQDFLNTKELTDAYIRAINSYFVAVFIDFMRELAIGLDIKDAKRRMIFKAIESAGRLKSNSAK